MSQQAKALEKAGWVFMSSKKRGMFVHTFWKEPARVDGRYRETMEQWRAYACHSGNRRNKLIVYVPDLKQFEGRAGWRVVGANSVEVTTKPEPAASVVCFPASLPLPTYGQGWN